MNWPPSEKCDVRDADSLELFHVCACECKMVLAGSDTNSIENQLAEIAWQDAIYRSFNEGLRRNQKKKVPHPVPASVIELLHDRYFWSQALLLRRLFEGKAFRAKREVYSLPTVWFHIQAAKQAIIREAYVCYDGTYYDPDNPRHDRLGRMKCAGRHRIFDSFCDRRDGGRRRDDHVSPNAFAALARACTMPARLEYYVNKFAAHASDPANRAPPTGAPALLSLRYLQDLHQRAIWLALSLGKLVDQLVLTEVPTPQFDQFESWDRSVFNENENLALHRYWKKRIALMGSWGRKYWSVDKFYLSPTWFLK